MRVDVRTGLAIAGASEVGAAIYIREPQNPELVAAAGPGVAVTWIRAAELVAACRGNIATATGESVEARLQLETRR
jgi:hypothetical protein